ncbi:hypothetical protein CVT26_015864 [Gymnopilus dilepis]|uniref:Uncharacterized protein n=1 Tax=Gymnopilus dilepis TaxID=231916 RepID=A0A409XY84_9AGAR|nr:hypothetical protein CVT26_015864 [Gymnopilus dilepis]
MFKRVEKRRRKKQEEEELGLDEDMKEVLGIQETDSEESASDTDSDSEGEDGFALGEEDEELEGADLGAEEEAGSEEEDDEQGEDEDPNISVGQALDEPIYVVSVLPDIRSCIVCPGKLLKSAKMAHERRFKLLKRLSQDCDRDESAWEVIRRHDEERQKLPEVQAAKHAAPTLSRRAEKKKAQQARRKLKREKFKARQAAKKTAAATASDSKTESTPQNTSVASSDLAPGGTNGSSSLRPKKKRRIGDTSKSTLGTASKEPAVGISGKKRSPSKPIEDPAHDAPEVPSASNKISEKKALPAEDVSVKSIVRSASDRAKNARSKALIMSKQEKSDKISSKKSAKLP